MSEPAVAALYIDPRGPYPRMRCGRNYVPVGPHGEPDCYYVGSERDINCWNEGRDARLYEGPHPIVAHPPCTHYVRVRHLGKRDDADCAPRAVEQVRRWGGVLEHPARSVLWELEGLPLPGEYGCGCFDRRAPKHRCSKTIGFSVEVDQVEWGHACRKRTWLYLVGVPRSALEAPPFPGRKPTHWCSGGRTKSSRKGSPIPPGIKAASAQIKRRTPPLFAEYLVRLARSVRC